MDEMDPQSAPSTITTLDVPRGLGQANAKEEAKDVMEDGSKVQEGV